MLTLTLAALSIGGFILWRLMGKKYRLPPGPRGLPFFGNVFQLDKTCPHDTITQWSDQYGDVMKIKLFGNEFVVLSSFDAIYEGLVTKANDFAGRPPFYRMEVLRRFADDVAFTTYSSHWVFLKKTTMQALKMYGDNLEKLELITLDLIQDMMEELREAIKESNFVDVKPIVHRCVTGIITSVMYGKKVGKEDIANLLHATNEGQTLLEPDGPNVLLDIIPASRHILRRSYAKLLEVRSLNEHWFKREIKDRRLKHEEGNPECFVDALFGIQRKCRQNNEELQLSEESIYGLNTNIVFAGTVTTSVSLQCLIAVLINKPEVQQKMADVIAEGIGDNEPHLKDRTTLPYIEAAVLELLRYSSILPLNIPHYTMVDTNINGYDIPKNTRVMYNLWKLHHDSEFWDDPWEFRPDRFLDDDGTVVPVDHVNRKRLLPFGASRRVCVGETLAKNRLFLMVTSLVQQFQFLPAEEKPSHDPRTYVSGFGVLPKDYLVKLVPRQ